MNPKNTYQWFYLHFISYIYMKKFTFVSFSKNILFAVPRKNLLKKKKQSVNIFSVLPEKSCFLKDLFWRNVHFIFLSNNYGKTHCNRNFNLFLVLIFTSKLCCVIQISHLQLLCQIKKSINCSSYAWSHLKLKRFIREVFNLRDVSRSRRLKQSVVGGDCEIKSPFNRSSQLIQLPTPPISPEP